MYTQYENLIKKVFKSKLSQTQTYSYSPGKKKFKTTIANERNVRKARGVFNLKIQK